MDIEHNSSSPFDKVTYRHVLFQRSQLLSAPALESGYVGIMITPQPNRVFFESLNVDTSDNIRYDNILNSWAKYEQQVHSFFL